MSVWGGWGHMNFHVARRGSPLTLTFQQGGGGGVGAGVMFKLLQLNN